MSIPCQNDIVLCFIGFSGFVCLREAANPSTPRGPPSSTNPNSLVQAYKDRPQQLQQPPLQLIEHELPNQQLPQQQQSQQSQQLQQQPLYPVPSALPPPPTTSRMGSPTTAALPSPFQLLHSTAAAGPLLNSLPSSIIANTLQHQQPQQQLQQLQQQPSHVSFQKQLPPFANFSIGGATQPPPPTSSLQQQHQLHQQQQLPLQPPQQQHLSVYASAASPLRQQRATSFFAAQTLAALPPLSSNSSSSSSSSSKLTVDDIKKELQRRGVECPESIWRDPQPEEVQGLLSVALELILGSTIQRLRVEEITGEVKRSGLSAWSFVAACTWLSLAFSFARIDSRPFLTLDGRTHLRGIGNLRWFRQCQKLAKSVLGIADFNRSHVFSPTPQTVWRLGAALCNFLRVRDAVHAEAGPLAEALDKAQAANVKAEEDLRVTEQQLVHLTAGRDAQQQHAAQLRKQRQLLTTAVSSLEVELTSVQDKRDLQEKQQQRMQQEVREAMQELSRLHQQREDLMDQIVHSPNKLKQKRLELQEEQRRQDVRLADVSLQRRQQQLLQQQVARALKKALKAERLLEAHKTSHLQPCVAARQELRANEKTQKELLQRRQQLQQQLQQLQLDYQQQQQQLLREEQHGSEEIKNLRDRVHAAKQEAEAFYVALPAQQETLRLLQQQVVELEAALKRGRRRHADLLVAVKAAEEDILRAFRTYVAQLDACRLSLPASAALGLGSTNRDSQENEAPLNSQQQQQQKQQQEMDEEQFHSGEEELPQASQMLPAEELRPQQLASVCMQPQRSHQH
ncbi:hypothetical protein Esti_002260 [Eimeria stiedai]